MKEIVIKLPDDYNVNMGAEILIDAVIDGVELPKGHGRLIDADNIDYIVLGDLIYCIKWTKDNEVDLEMYAQTVIEADKEN